MAKDPAVLFYTSDFISGTLTMTDEQRGQYIMLLCVQHQKGFLTEKDMLKICDSYDEDIWQKFVKTDDGRFFNERMKYESEKRNKYSESRANNRKSNKKNPEKGNENKHMKNISETYEKHMENENENINENIIVEGGMGGDPAKYPKDFISEVIQIFQTAYKETRGEEYIITNDRKERMAAGNLLNLYKKRNPSVNTEATRDGLLYFFKQVCNINDQWLYKNMSLTLLYSKINEILTILKNGKPKGYNGNSKGKQSPISDDFKKRVLENMLS
jgi:uncharacterized protein YdaU (DUF1376 family)